MLVTLQLISPYPPLSSPSPDGASRWESSRDFLPFGYIVGGASHPVISATAACPPRDLREYASCCPAGNTGWQQIQSRDLVSRLTEKFSGRPRPSVGTKPPAGFSPRSQQWSQRRGRSAAPTIRLKSLVRRSSSMNSPWPKVLFALEVQATFRSRRSSHAE